MISIARLLLVVPFLLILVGCKECDPSIFPYYYGGTKELVGKCRCAGDQYIVGGEGTDRHGGTCTYYPKPQCTIYPDRYVAESGSEVTLTLQTTGNISAATIDGISFSPASGGTKVVVPTKQYQEYVATVWGLGGITTCKTSVTTTGDLIGPSPSPSISPSPSPSPTTSPSPSPSPSALPKITVLSVEANPTAVTTDIPVTFTVKLQNQGSVAATDFEVTLYKGLDAPPTITTPKDPATTMKVSTLVRGQIKILTFKVYYFSAGSRNAYVLADSYGKYPSSNLAGSTSASTSAMTTSSASSAVAPISMTVTESNDPTNVQSSDCTLSADNNLGEPNYYVNSSKQRLIQDVEFRKGAVAPYAGLGYYLTASDGTLSADGNSVNYTATIHFKDATQVSCSYYIKTASVLFGKYTNWHYGWAPYSNSFSGWNILNNVFLLIKYVDLPYLTTVKVEAEAFDIGGEGLSYHDIDRTNSGGSYRQGGVDIAISLDNEGSYDVVDIQPGEFLKYSIGIGKNFTTHALYRGTNPVDDLAYPFQVKARVSSPYSGKSFHIEFDGTDFTGPMTVPNTGSFQKYKDIVSKEIYLSGGTHIMKVVADTDGFNVNYFNIVYGRPPSPTPLAPVAPNIPPPDPSVTPVRLCGLGKVPAGGRTDMPCVCQSGVEGEDGKCLFEAPPFHCTNSLSSLNPGDACNFISLPFGKFGSREFLGGTYQQYFWDPLDTNPASSGYKLIEATLPSTYENSFWRTGWYGLPNLAVNKTIECQPGMVPLYDKCWYGTYTSPNIGDPECEWIPCDPAALDVWTHYYNYGESGYEACSNWGYPGFGRCKALMQAPPAFCNKATGKRIAIGSDLQGSIDEDFRFGKNRSQAIATNMAQAHDLESPLADLSNGGYWWCPSPNIPITQMDPNTHESITPLPTQYDFTQKVNEPNCILSVAANPIYHWLDENANINNNNPTSIKNVSRLCISITNTIGEDVISGLWVQNYFNPEYYLPTKGSPINHAMSATLSTGDEFKKISFLNQDQYVGSLFAPIRTGGGYSYVCGDLGLEVDPNMGVVSPDGKKITYSATAKDWGGNQTASCSITLDIKEINPNTFQGGVPGKGSIPACENNVNLTGDNSGDPYDPEYNAIQENILERL